MISLISNMGEINAFEGAESLSILMVATALIVAGVGYYCLNQIGGGVEDPRLATPSKAPEKTSGMVRLTDFLKAKVKTKKQADRAKERSELQKLPTISEGSVGKTSLKEISSVAQRNAARSGRRLNPSVSCRNVAALEHYSLSQVNSLGHSSVISSRLL